MFFSLNRKILLTILSFFAISAIVFIIIFDNTIGQKIRTQKNTLITRNKYVIELLNENISLRQKINKLQPDLRSQMTPSLNKKQEELSRENKLNEEAISDYDANYASLKESMQILIFSVCLTILSLIILWILLRRWVLKPVSLLINLSVDVANGCFDRRINTSKGKYTDEFDTLIHTVNFMLTNIENNINEIKEKETFLQSLIDAVPDAIRVIDENYNIILSNKAYSDYIKKKYLHSACRCYATYQKDAQIPCSNNLFLCPLRELKKKNLSSIKIIHSVNDHPLSINSARISLNGNFGIVESIRDLSDNINYSHQQKISSLGFLATSLAHEMKNNLGAINMILEGILQKYHKKSSNDSEEIKFLTMISDQIKECILVPERLLKLSRNVEQKENTFNVITEITDVLNLLDYDIKSKGISLVKKFSNLKENIHGNETDFKMIILNLLHNAIKAMPNGGILEIKTNTSKDKLYISISDTGCGIPEKSIKHIFEPFFTSSDSPNHQSTGLGLAIVKNLVIKMNAQITVNSKENVGSTFNLTIPRQK